MQFVRKDGTPTEFIIIPAKAKGETVYFEVIGKLHPTLESGKQTFMRVLIQKVYLKED